MTDAERIAKLEAALRHFIASYNSGSHGHRRRAYATAVRLVGQADIVPARKENE